jgi:transposase InsO family protein
VSRYRFIAAEKANYSVRLLCRVLEVARAAYYEWAQGKKSDKEVSDEALIVHIKAVWRRSRHTYGYPRVTAELKAQGLDVGKRRVARLMRENGIVGIPKRKRGPKSKGSESEKPPAENLLNRQFTATEPNQAWVGDITYLPILGGFVYLAVLIDLFSRKVVGWALQSHMETSLCLAALSRAVAVRQPTPGLLHHTDRGSQYCSHEYQAALATLGARVSMSRKGNCWDNAVSESFFGTLEQELLLVEGPFANEAAAVAAVSDYIHNFYNSERRHSTLGQVSPIAFEQAHQRAA